MFQNYYSWYIRKGLVFFVFSALLVFDLTAVCPESNTTTTSITSLGTLTGQSFTMANCGNGNFTSIAILQTSNNSNVTLRIYDGAGFGGSVLYTQTGITFSVTAPTNNVITLSGGTGSLAFTSGQTYTFQLEVGGGAFQLSKSNTDVYSGGDRYDSGGSAQSDDLFFIVNTDASVLPVEMTNFNVFSKNDNVILEWETASEFENAGFEIERSRNSKDWEVIGFIKGQGTSNSNQNYLFNDKSPFEGLNYYRLRQLDFDGRVDYSFIRSVQFKVINEDKIKIYPNPASPGESLIISTEDYTQLSVTFLDYTGKVIFNDLIINNQTLRLPHHLADGFYTLILTGEGIRLVRKILIQ